MTEPDNLTRKVKDEIKYSKCVINREIRTGDIRDPGVQTKQIYKWQRKAL